MKNGINRTTIYEHLVEKQFNLIDKTIQDALLYPSWKDTWYISPKQKEEFKNYAVPLIKRVFKCNKKKAESTYDWFLLQHGLKVKR